MLNMCFFSFQNVKQQVNDVKNNNNTSINKQLRKKRKKDMGKKSTLYQNSIDKANTECTILHPDSMYTFMYTFANSYCPVCLCRAKRAETSWCI